MPDKIVLLKYSQLTGSNPMLSMQAFAKKTGKTVQEVAAIAQAQELEGGAIYDFKIGKIEEKAFIARMNEALGAKPPINYVVVRNCWNEMCIISEEQLAFLMKLQELQEKQGFNIIVATSSNMTHHRFIAEQFQTNDLTDLFANIRFICSFDPEVKNLQPKVDVASLEEQYEIVDLTALKDPSAILQALHKPPAPGVTGV